MSTFKFIDLFSGIGGFHQAAHRLNGECVLACDINKDSRETYQKNYNIEPKKDITKLKVEDIPDFDILCAGFPCQAFSNAGKKKSFGDKRGKLFDHIIRIAVEKKPKFMFLENVKHIKKIDGGKVFKYIIDTLNDNNYYIEETETVFELSPHQLGIPQQRARIIFVCIRKDLYDKSKKIDMDFDDIPVDFSKFFETDSDIINKYKISEETEEILSVWDKMIQKMDVKQKLSPTILCDEFHNTYTDEEFEQLVKWRRDYITKNKPIYNKYKKDWDKWYKKNKDLLTKKKVYSKLEWQAGPKKKNDSIFNHFIQIRQSGIRVKKNKFFPTLVAIVQTPIYGKEKRYITPRECARLQSFPEDFILPENDNVAYKQFGNAVNVDVIYKVMSETFKVYHDDLYGCV